MEFKISYDYNDLLAELKSDIAEFDVQRDDNLYIVRGEPVRYNEYIYVPIIDYYLEDDLSGIDEEVDIKKAYEVIDEMEEVNKLI